MEKKFVRIGYVKGGKLTSVSCSWDPTIGNVFRILKGREKYQTPEQVVESIFNETGATIEVIPTDIDVIETIKENYPTLHLFFVAEEGQNDFVCVPVNIGYILSSEL